MNKCLFAVAAVLFAAGLTAHASTIDFNGLSGANFTPFTTYSEDGFTVTNSAGQYLVGTVYGDPVPSLFSGSADSPSGTASASITVTEDGGGAFTFTSAALAQDLSAGSYNFEGFFGGTEVFDQSGSLYTGLPGSPFSTFDSTDPGAVLTSLVITESGPDYNVDNIVVTAAASPTPEPSSLLLFGTGIVGLAGAMRRRLA